MLNTILGTKSKMSQAYIGNSRVPVTIVKAGPCVVVHIKREEKDGYWAVQLGFGERKTKNIAKPVLGHLKGAAKEKRAPRFLREVRVEKEPELKVGDVVNVSEVFRQGDVVKISGVSKGKGFAGGVKRWRFSGGPKTHGQSDRQRAPGSIGQGTTPGRVLKGKHMAGRMGGAKVTVKNLQVVSIDSEKGEVLLSGPIPGPNGQLVTVTKISSGKLEEKHEVQPQVIEGEPENVSTETSEKKETESPVAVEGEQK